MRIAVLDDIHHAWESTRGIERLRERAQVEIHTAPVDSPAALAGFDAIIANRERTPFTRDLFAGLPDLRVIAQTGNHADHIDFDAARDAGVVVAKASGGTSMGTVELTFGLMMAVMRRIPACDAAIARGMWPTPITPVLYGKTLGIVGLGRLGRQVAKIGNAFGMRVLAWSPHLTEGQARENGAEYRALDELMAQSDVVTIHVALKPETRGLINARRMELMKPTAYLINTARGPIVEEAALVRALAEEQIAGAAMDVFDTEPLPAGHPLSTLANVVRTPHIGWPTDAAYEKFAESAADVLLAFMDGKDVPLFS